MYNFSFIHKRKKRRSKLRLHDYKICPCVFSLSSCSFACDNLRCVWLWCIRVISRRQFWERRENENCYIRSHKMMMMTFFRWLFKFPNLTRRCEWNALVYERIIISNCAFHKIQTRKKRWHGHKNVNKLSYSTRWSQWWDEKRLARKHHYHHQHQRQQQQLKTHIENMKRKRTNENSKKPFKINRKHVVHIFSFSSARRLLPFYMWCLLYVWGFCNHFTKKNSNKVSWKKTQYNNESERRLKKIKTKTKKNNKKIYICV